MPCPSGVPVPHPWWSSAEVAVLGPQLAPSLLSGAPTMGGPDTAPSRGLLVTSEVAIWDGSVAAQKCRIRDPHRSRGR